LKDNKEYFQDIILYDYIDVITDYHSNGAYQKLKENVTLKYEEDYAIMVRTLNFEANNFASNLIYINEKEYNFLSKSKVYENDILMNKIANAGSVYVMPKHNKPTSLAMNLFLIRFNNLLNQKYMYYLMKTNEAYIKNFANGTSTLTITKESVKNLKFQVPSLLIQNKIASILSNLDKKIELNNQINQKLESMAKTLYDYWFVQFDFPDADGKPYKSSGGKMVYSEELKREIPEGWEIKELAQIENNIVTGKTPSTKVREYYNGDVPFISIGDIRGNMYIVETENTLTELGAESQRKKYIPKNSICVSCIASIGLIGFATKDSQTNQQINSVVCNNFENRYFLYFALNDYFRFSGVKTGNTFANMNKQDFSEILVIYPSKDTLEKFSTILKSSMEKVLNNSLENQKLTQLRDWLLPMLMNGQVGVK